MNFMKQVLYLLAFLPMFSLAQKKAKQTKTVPKKVAVQTVKPVVKPDGYTIDGEIAGFEDGTKVTLLNGMTGTPENETTISKNKFSFKGKVATPDFKIILLNNQPPYIILFLDNSSITVNGSRNAIDQVVLKGSKSCDELMEFNQAFQPYTAIMNNPAAFDSSVLAAPVKVCTDFARKHPSSFISPFVLIRYEQLVEDKRELVKLYNDLSAEVKASSMGVYLEQKVQEAKINPIGTVLDDFSQADTSGKMVSLSSLRGKFVLVDFWASWCRPCRNENPNVVAAYQKYKDKNFTVLGISLDSDRQSWINAINTDGLTWQHLSDLQRGNNAVAVKFQISLIPQNFLLAPDGTIIGKNLRGAALERKLSAYLK